MESVLLSRANFEVLASLAYQQRDAASPYGLRSLLDRITLGDSHYEFLFSENAALTDADVYRILNEHVQCAQTEVDVFTSMPQKTLIDNYDCYKFALDTHKCNNGAFEAWFDVLTTATDRQALVLASMMPQVAAKGLPSFSFPIEAGVVSAGIAEVLAPDHLLTFYELKLPFFFKKCVYFMEVKYQPDWRNGDTIILTRSFQSFEQFEQLVPNHSLQRFKEHSMLGDVQIFSMVSERDERVRVFYYIVLRLSISIPRFLVSFVLNMHRLRFYALRRALKKMLLLVQTIAKYYEARDSTRVGSSLASLLEYAQSMDPEAFAQSFAQEDLDFDALL